MGALDSLQRPFKSGCTLGKNIFLFDVLGDMMNIANRMEKNFTPNQINIAKNTYLNTPHKHKFIERLSNDIKDLGIKEMIGNKTNKKAALLYKAAT